MKIECDKCGAKYSIADEKVRGKTFKIRCKRCSNVIIVRDKAAADSAGETAPQPEAEAPAGWHIAVDGETLGPIPEAEVRSRYEAGEIDKETAVWQEGFEDWISLGEVDVFADLPDRSAPAAGGAAGLGAAAFAGAAASGGDDPFGAGSDEGFGAGGEASGGGFSAPSASPSPEPAPAAASPRVSGSNLTGQRNENSVLFSLESLQAMAGGGGGGGGGGGAAPARTKIATSAPTSEGSGLIDIRAMGAMFEGGGGGGAGAGAASGGGEEEAALPTFGGGGFGGLSATPLVTAPVDAPAAKEEEKKSSNGPLYAAVGVLALGLLGLAGYIVFGGSGDEDDDEPIAAAAPSVDDAAKDAELEEMRKQLDALKKAQEEALERGEKPPETVEEMEAQKGDDKAGDGDTKKRTTTTRKKPSGGGGGGGGSTPTTTTPKKEEPAKSSGDDVDCLLNPGLAKCKSGGSKTSGTKTGGSGGGSAPAGAPAKLSASDLLAGINKVKNAAAACGSKHGVSGKKVAVKLSIEGSTGRVVSASATGEFAGTPVGNCAAAELKKATFKQFQAPQQGFTYKVSM